MPRSANVSQEERREVAGVVGVRDCRPGAGTWDSGTPMYCSMASGVSSDWAVHRVEVLDAVAELDLGAVLGDRAADGVMQHDAAQAADVDGA